MPDRIGKAAWEGTLRDGHGRVALGSGAFEGPYSYSSRWEDGSGTNPEELIGAAHAGCFSMAFAHSLAQAGFTPGNIDTTASVRLSVGPEGSRISRVLLETKASVPNIDEATFQEHAEKAKKGCPVSQALTGVDIELKAELAK